MSRKKGTVPTSKKTRSRGQSLFSIISLSLLVFFILFTTAFADDPQGEFYPAKIKDISDRAYESAVIELLDNAKQSIVMSMYILKPVKDGPVHLLVKDLEEALARGVSVEIYLNTHQDSSTLTGDVITPPLEELIKKGAKIYKASPNMRLHDKLIIVDGRYVVEGSMNWSVSAIKSNCESAVLIDSPELAKEKIVRVRRLVLEGTRGRDKPRPDRPKGLARLAEGTIVNGTGVQRTTNSRWGDYTSLNVDPKDDCTFWYVNEYYTAVTRPTPSFCSEYLKASC